MMGLVSQPRGFASSPSLGQLPGASVVPGLFFLGHDAQACKHPRHDPIQPLHVGSLRLRPENRTRRFRHGAHSTRPLGQIVQGLPRQ